MNGHLPFPVGQTWSNNGSPGSTDGAHLEGREYKILDLDYTTGKPRAINTNGETCFRCVRIVRNVSGVTLVPKKLVTFKTGYAGKQVDGYVRTTAAEGYPVDDALPYNVPANDLFYITVEGPAEILTDLAAGANNLLPADTVLVGLTAATSQSTTAGRVAPQDLTGATALLANQVQNAIGVALSARTTANTNVGILTHIYRKKF